MKFKDYFPELSDGQWKLLERTILDCLPEEPEDNERAGMPDRAFDDGYDAGFTMALTQATAAITNVFNETN